MLQRVSLSGLLSSLVQISSTLLWTKSKKSWSYLFRPSHPSSRGWRSPFRRPSRAVRRLKHLHVPSCCPNDVIKSFKRRDKSSITVCGGWISLLSAILQSQWAPFAIHEYSPLSVDFVATALHAPSPTISLTWRSTDPKQLPGSLTFSISIRIERASNGVCFLHHFRGWIIGWTFFWFLSTWMVELIMQSIQFFYFLDISSQLFKLFLVQTNSKLAFWEELLHLQFSHAYQNWLSICFHWPIFQSLSKVIFNLFPKHDFSKDIQIVAESPYNGVK